MQITRVKWWWRGKQKSLLKSYPTSTHSNTLQMFKHFNNQRQTCYISLYHDLNKPKWRMWSQKTHLATVTVCRLGDDDVVWPQHPWTNWTALWTQLNVGINSSGGISAHAALSMQPAHISSWQHTTRTPAGGKVQWEQSPWSWELTTSTTTSWLWLSTSYTRRHNTHTVTSLEAQTHAHPLSHTASTIDSRFNLSRHHWALLNCFPTNQGHYCASCRKKWGPCSNRHVPLWQTPNEVTLLTAAHRPSWGVGCSNCTQHSADDVATEWL